jgi:hypothetical protein
VAEFPAPASMSPLVRSPDELCAWSGSEYCALALDATVAIPPTATMHASTATNLRRRPDIIVPHSVESSSPGAARLRRYRPVHVARRRFLVGSDPSQSVRITLWTVRYYYARADRQSCTATERGVAAVDGIEKIRLFNREPTRAIVGRVFPARVGRLPCVDRAALAGITPISSRDHPRAAPIGSPRHHADRGRLRRVHSASC